MGSIYDNVELILEILEQNKDMIDADKKPLIKEKLKELLDLQSNANNSTKEDMIEKVFNEIINILFDTPTDLNLKKPSNEFKTSTQTHITRRFTRGGTSPASQAFGEKVNFTTDQSSAIAKASFIPNGTLSSLNAPPATQAVEHPNNGSGTLASGALASPPNSIVVSEAVKSANAAISTLALTKPTKDALVALGTQVIPQLKSEAFLSLLQSFERRNLTVSQQVELLSKLDTVLQNPVLIQNSTVNITNALAGMPRNIPIQVDAADIRSLRDYLSEFFTADVLNQISDTQIPRVFVVMNLFTQINRSAAGSHLVLGNAHGSPLALGNAPGSPLALGNAPSPGSALAIENAPTPLALESNEVNPNNVANFARTFQRKLGAYIPNLILTRLHLEVNNDIHFEYANRIANKVMTAFCRDKNINIKTQNKECMTYIVKDEDNELIYKLIDQEVTKLSLDTYKNMQSKKINSASNGGLAPPPENEDWVNKALNNTPVNTTPNILSAINAINGNNTTSVTLVTALSALKSYLEQTPSEVNTGLLAYIREYANKSARELKGALNDVHKPVLKYIFSLANSTPEEFATKIQIPIPGINPFSDKGKRRDILETVHGSLSNTSPLNAALTAVQRGGRRTQKRSQKGRSTHKRTQRPRSTHKRSRGKTPLDFYQRV